MSRAQLTITVSSDMGRYVEELAEESSLTKSAVIEEILKADQKQRIDDLLREGYLEMAERGEER